MQVTVEDLGSNTKCLKIALPADNVKKEMEKAYRGLSKTVSIRGFRKGKVPRKVLVREYGDRVENDLAEKMIQETYFDALEQTKLDAVAHPEIRSRKFEEDGTFVYEAEIAVRPDFELGEYKGLEIEIKIAGNAMKEHDCVRRYVLIDICCYPVASFKGKQKAVSEARIQRRKHSLVPQHGMVVVN